MPADQPDNTPSPHRRVPSPWIVFFGTLILFVGLNLWVLYDTFGAYGFDGMEEIGWPLAFFARGGLSYHEIFEPLNLLADIAIAIGAAAGLTYLMRNGWQEFWHWLRTAGVEYESSEEG